MLGVERERARIDEAFGEQRFLEAAVERDNANFVFCRIAVV